MSTSLLKMWLSLTSMGGMGLAVYLILFSRYKVQNQVWKGIAAFFAYCIMIVAGLLMLLVLLSGPTNE
ncbi:DUF2768 domain-containing protein [Ectobacillus sp. sgz5001026]|uniref:DUF2768 domain-containing protein n=1 Tax=Ectobacillus sp. sgz5001026 TaxID=3242473 RepID=UPI0036D20B53